MKRVAPLIALVCVLSLLGCAPPPQAPTWGLPRLGDAQASASARADMWAHATRVWPKAVQSLSDDSMTLDPIPPDLAERSRPGTPTVVWGWSEGTSAGADVWTGVARVAKATEYVIPVVVDGEPVASMVTNDYSGTWRVWPERNYALMAQDARTQLESFFGNSDFEWVYVDNAGMWVVARADGQTAGVYIDPILDHRKGDAPTGALSGATLRRWMDRPLGQ